MNGRDAFERAFVAVSYVLGRRGDVTGSLGGSAGDAARALSERLGSADRGERARLLANALLPIASALDARRVG